MSKFLAIAALVGTTAIAGCTQGINPTDTDRALIGAGVGATIASVSGENVVKGAAIGGAAGAFPPMVGWAVVTGGVSVESFVLFLIIFLWTPPHFWALALFKVKEYGAAGIPMLPNVAGRASTRRQIFLYSLVLVPCGVAPWLLGFSGPVYGVVSVLLGANFLRHAYAVLRMSDDDTAMLPAKKLFRFSIVYLFALFALLLAEGVYQSFLPGSGGL